MDDRRKFKRFPTQLSARYLGESEKEWKNCSVTNISREGMGIGVYSQERIHQESILQLEITLPQEVEKIKVLNVIKWIKELNGNSGFNFIGGVRLIAIDPEDKWAILDYAYDDYSRNEEE